LLAACGTPVSESEQTSAKAESLAASLQSELEAQSLNVPDAETLTALYGEDGGWSCVVVGDREQTEGLALFGSPTYGRYAVMDPSVLAYDEAVIKTYCPESLEAFEDATADLTTETTIP
jgi:hypothetical protein